MHDFSRRLLHWHQQSGRHDLPWQLDLSPYRIWVSEVMLQQTQVSAVIPYFQRFVERFSDVECLARADIDEVLHLWSGLGYYSRARNLHKSALIISQQMNGCMPDQLIELMDLPGIGRSTAGAILSLSMGQCQPILDGNVKRVLCRYKAIAGWPGERSVEKQLWKLAEKLTPKSNAAEYTQAIMDLGALVCRRNAPACHSCPLSVDCLANAKGRQSELPEKKPKRKLPIRQTQFAVIENQEGRIMLHRRPPPGIWGGLWSFPECPVDADISIWIKNTYGFTVADIEYGKDFKHTFSHFYLEIRPVRMKLGNIVGGIKEDSDLYWYNPANNEKPLGMASPIQKLVNNMYKLPLEA